MLADSVHDRAIAIATDLGRDAGLAAASWTFDGNTGENVYRRILQGLEDGDPAVFDDLPSADLSGQWADEPTARSIAESVANELGVDVGTMSHDNVDRIADAYCDAFNDAAASEVERMAREHLA